MTLAAASWGQGSGVGSYALAHAEVALRLLLPARTADDVPTPWAAVARDLDQPGPVDAYTSWNVLTELDAHGGAVRTTWSHPEGRLSADVAHELVVQLTAVVGTDVSWHYAENADRGGMWSELVPPGGETYPATGTVKPVRTTARLSALAVGWVVGGFHGRAWDSTATVGLAADSYADSLIVSGPRSLAPVLVASNLEVFALPSRHRTP